ncbi:WD40-repeat-containing domain protein, partial [Crucibulum laeve]
KTLTGHRAGVTCVSYSPDNKWIASGDAGGTIKIWDVDISLEGDNLIYSLEDHSSTIRASYSAAYAPDGKHIVSGSWDNTIRIWSVETRETDLGPLKGHTDGVCSVSYSPDAGQHIASTSYDHTIYCVDVPDTIRIWDAKTREPLVDSLSQPDGIFTSAYLPDGKLFAARCNDRNIYLWGLQTSSHIIEPLKGHSGYIDCVSISPNGKHLVSCSTDYTVRIWDLETGKQAIPSLVFHRYFQTHSVAYSADGKHIVSGSEDKSVQI